MKISKIALVTALALGTTANAFVELTDAETDVKVRSTPTDFKNAYAAAAASGIPNAVIGAGTGEDVTAAKNAMSTAPAGTLALTAQAVTDTIDNSVAVTSTAVANVAGKLGVASGELDADVDDISARVLNAPTGDLSADVDTLRGKLDGATAANAELAVDTAAGKVLAAPTGDLVADIDTLRGAVDGATAASAGAGVAAVAAKVVAAPSGNLDADVDTAAAKVLAAPTGVLGTDLDTALALFSGDAEFNAVQATLLGVLGTVANFNTAKGNLAARAIPNMNAGLPADMAAGDTIEVRLQKIRDLAFRFLNLGTNGAGDASEDVSDVVGFAGASIAEVLIGLVAIADADAV